jgi:hypothetical protein
MDTDNTNRDAEPSPASAGSQPVAWAVTSQGRAEEIDCEFVYPSAATAGDVALDAGGVVVPLYRSPTLTDEEREAVAYFAAFHSSPRESDANAAATLRGLLERT